MKLIRSVLFLAAIAPFASAATIDIQSSGFFEDFEGGIDAEVVTTGTWTGTQFQVVSGSIDHINVNDNPTNPYGALCLNGTSCVDTTGAGTSGRGEIQTIDDLFFAPGDYRLSFDLQGWSDFTGFTRSATIQIILPGIFDTIDNVTFFRDGTLNPYGPAILDFTVSAPTLTRLTFRDVSNPASDGVSSFAGAALDNVQIGTLVPEPSSMALVILGLGGLAVGIRRRSILHQP